MNDVRIIEVPTGLDDGGFDWGQPGDRPFVRGNERQARFAFAKLQGHNHTESARLAGYHGSESTLATQGSRCMRSRDVAALMAAASTAAGEFLDLACEPDEILRRLSVELRKPGVRPAEKAQVSNAMRAIRGDMAAALSNIETVPVEELLGGFSDVLCEKCLRNLAKDYGVDFHAIRKPSPPQSNGVDRSVAQAHGAPDPGVTDIAPTSHDTAA